MDYMYTNKDLNLTVNIPAHICARCDAIIYEPDDYCRLLMAEEAIQGRPYVKVESRNGRVYKYSVH